MCGIVSGGNGQHDEAVGKDEGVTAVLRVAVSRNADDRGDHHQQACQRHQQPPHTADTPSAQVPGMRTDIHDFLGRHGRHAFLSLNRFYPKVAEGRRMSRITLKV